MVIKLIIDMSATSIQSVADFNSMVSRAVRQYFTTRLNQFNNSYIGAEMIHYIRSLDRAISSVDIAPTLLLRVGYNPGVRRQVQVSFGNKIRYATVTSQPITVLVGSGNPQLARVKDVPAGFRDEVAYATVGDLYLVDEATGRQITKIGTVDYTSGDVDIHAINITAAVSPDKTWLLTAELRGFDAFSRRNTIITQDETPPGSVQGITTGVFVSTTTR
jgi:hypothetical protein